MTTQAIVDQLAAHLREHASPMLRNAAIDHDSATGIIVVRGSGPGVKLSPLDASCTRFAVGRLTPRPVLPGVMPSAPDYTEVARIDATSPSVVVALFLGWVSRVLTGSN